MDVNIKENPSVNKNLVTVVLMLFFISQSSWDLQSMKKSHTVSLIVCEMRPSPVAEWIYVLMALTTSVGPLLYSHYYHCLIDIHCTIHWNLSKSNPLGTNFCVLNRQECSLYRLNLRNTSYIGTLYKVWFIQDFGSFRVRFRQISLYMVCNAVNNR